MQVNKNVITSGIKIFFSELFYVLTIALLVFVCLEIIWPGIILAYLNLNFVLMFWLVGGIIIIILG